MQTIQVTLPNSDKQAELRVFASDDRFESMNNYIEHTLAPFVWSNIPEALWIRDAVSGYVIGQYLHSEIELTVRQSAKDTGFWRFNDMVNGFDLDDFASAVESLLDDIAIRTLIISRKSPAMATSKGRPSIETAPRPRQLMALVSRLLYDTGLHRDRGVPDFESIVNRYRLSAAVADLIESEWDGRLGTGSESVESNRFEDLFAGLVELDAKWQIQNLTFTKTEKERLKALGESWDIDALRALVWEMIVYRDKHVDIDPATGWTSRAYREVTFQTFNPERTNIAVDKGPSNRHVKVKPNSPNYKEPVKKPTKSKDPNRAAFSSIIGGLF